MDDIMNPSIGTAQRAWCLHPVAFSPGVFCRKKRLGIKLLPEDFQI
jgi:hypothetical protein